MYVRRYETPMGVANVLPPRAEASNSRQNGRKNGHKMKKKNYTLQVLNYRDE